MKTSIQIAIVVNATLTNLGIFTVNYDLKASEESIEGRFNGHGSHSGRTSARGFTAEDQGVRRLEIAILQLGLDTDLPRETLAVAVASRDEASPWRFGGIKALLTLGLDDARNEDFNLIAFASPCNIPSDSCRGYPILNPSKRRLDIHQRARNEVILIVRDAPIS